MEHLQTENYPGTNGEDFRIRIIDQHSHIEMSIILIIDDNGNEREINIQRHPYPPDSKVEDLTAIAKETINGITILKHQGKIPENEADMFSS